MHKDIGINHGKEAPDNGRKLMRALGPASFESAAKRQSGGRQSVTTRNCNLHTRFRPPDEVVKLKNPPTSKDVSGSSS